MDKHATKGLSVQQLATMCLLTAILLGVQVIMAGLPNIEIVSLLIVLYTRKYGGKALGIIYAFVLLQGMLYGFGLWFMNYLYVWAVLWGVTMALRNMVSHWGWVLVLATFGLFFGLLCAIPYLFMGGPGMAWGYFLSGIPFDLLHCVGNAALAAFLFKPLERVFAEPLPKERIM